MEKTGTQRMRRSWLDALAVVLVVALFAFAFLTPAERTQGDVARLFYLHVPGVLMAYAAFGVALVGSLAYLATRDIRWDHLAVAGAEVGVVFTGLTLVVGMIWAKPTWGVYWTWSARLTLTAIMFFVYLGYLTLRRAIDDPQARARRAAIYGTFSIVQVPIVHFSVVWWRDVHQGQTLLGPGPMQMDGILRLAFFVGLAAMAAVTAAAIRRRYLLAAVEHQIETAIDAGIGAVAGAAVSAPQFGSDHEASS
jgi:heme exporter protein C